MAGLWRYNEATKEGKYPIVLRRDGTPLTSRYMVLALKDPATAAALRAYADEAERIGMDPQYVQDARRLADEAVIEAQRVKDGAEKADPDAPPHRADDPAVLAWARSIGCPGS